MAFLIGFDPNQTFSDPTEGKTFNVLTETKGNDGKRWVFVQANGAIDQYDGVTIDETGQAAKITKATVDVNHKIGVAPVAFADNDYGWVQVSGEMIANTIGTATTVDIPVYTSGTAGVFGVSATSQTKIRGLVFTADAGTTDEASVAAYAATEMQSDAF